MNPSQLKTKFISQVTQDFPALRSEQITPLVSDQLLSPFVVELPKDVLVQAQEFVASTFKMRQQASYTEKFSQELADRGLKMPGNYSILMSYDFHLSAETQILKLIEINTNAAFLALGDSMYKAQGLSQPIAGFSLNEIRENILQEICLNTNAVASEKSSAKKLNIAITDDQPEQQKLYLEFLIFAELFKSWGWNAQIEDYRKLQLPLDFIYNRYTDFFLSDPSSAHLKEWFNSRSVTLSPNPAEYLFLADKTRMIEWGSALSKHLPTAKLLSSTNAEEIWGQRKNLFFKPRQSFGSKQTYKGAKISRRLFEEIMTQDFLAQEFVPAPEKTFETEMGPQEFKYDLRFYAYQDRVQSVVARLYQGQVTNLKSPYGGFACVRFV